MQNQCSSTKRNDWWQPFERLFSDLAWSMSSCVGSTEEAPANRETVKDNGKVVRSLESHDCEHLSFLEIILTNVSSLAVLAIRIPLVSLI